MADEFDRASDYEERFRQSAENSIRAQAAKIPVGEPGDCDHCGETFTRLVNGLCGRCRDHLGLG